ncbi:MAG: Hpt domain-containing protein [Clostridiales bacterium]|nr:Hpt domain-containing protein [Candidatus Scatonaster coprocaballi]
MTLQDFYLTVGGNYTEVIDRLLDEQRVLKYLRRFKTTPDYDEMLQAIEAEDWETAFRSSHSIKGMALNLCLGNLAKSSSELCETMRHGAPTVDIAPLLDDMKEKYQEALDQIEKID